MVMVAVTLEVAGALRPGTWTAAQTTKVGTMHNVISATKRLNTVEEQQVHIVLSVMTEPGASDVRNR